MPRRLRAQGVVEFGLIIAAAAIVMIAGLNAMTRAQEAYWGASTPTFASPTPSTGTFLHPTSIDQPSCLPSTPTKVGTAITCIATVHDIYIPASDRNPPWGTLNFILNGSSIGTCSLPHISSGTQNMCSLTWTPLGAAYVGTWPMLAGYQTPESNHGLSSSALPLALQFIPNLVWSVSCVNDIVPPTLPAGQAEVGHPLRCQVTLKDQSSGTPGVVPTGTPVTWSTSNGGALDHGVGMFTCDVWPAVPLGAPSPYPNASPAIDIFSDPKCIPAPAGLQPPLIIPNGTASFTCWTDGNGRCSILYRRLYDTAGGPNTGNSTLTLRALGDAYTQTVAIVAPLGAHPSTAVAWCTTTDVNVNPEDYLPNWTFRDGQFRGTQHLDVTGPTATVLSCTAAIFDADHNPALDAYPPNSNPNTGDAHPPRGTVTFKYNGSTVAACTLLRADMAAPPTQQARGQAPFMSTCSPASTFSIAGTVNGPTSPCGGTVSMGCIDVEYSGDPGHAALTTGWPAAIHNSYQITVDYH